MPARRSLCPWICSIEMPDQLPKRYDPQAIEARRQAAWRARDAFRTPELTEGAAAQVHQALRTLHLGQHPHRPRPLLLDRRRLRTFLARARGCGAVRVRLRRVRPARRARRDRKRRVAERVGQPLRRAHDRPARSPRLLLRLGAHVPQLGRDHVPLVAVAVPHAARGRPDLPRDRQRRLVRHLPDDARHDPGRGRPLLALPQPRPADPAPAVVPAHQRLRAGERPPPRRSSRPAASGTRSRSPASASCSAASTASSSTCSPPTAPPDRLHAPRRRAGAGALRADLPQAPRVERWVADPQRARAPRGAPLRWPGARAPATPRRSR